MSSYDKRLYHLNQESIAIYLWNGWRWNINMEWFCVGMEAGCCRACLSKRPHTTQRNCKAVPSTAIEIRGIYQICVTIFQRTRGRKEKGVEQTAFMRGMVMVEVRNKRFFTLSGVSSLGPGHKPFTFNP